MAIAFDAAGAGASVSIASFVTSGSMAQTHVVGSGVNRWLWGIVIGTGPAALTGAVTTMKYGGVAMTSLGRAYNSSNLNFIEIFYLANPTSGSASMAFTIASIPSNISAAQFAMGSTSYAGVAGIGTAIVAGATTATANAVAAAASPAGMVAYFHMKQVASAFTAYSQTSRYTGAQASFGRLLMGDAVGTGSSVTSTATQASAATWSAVAIPMTAALTADASLAVTATRSAGAGREQSAAASLAVTATPTVDAVAMPVTVVASSTAGTNNSSPITANKPTGTVDGDMMIAFLSDDWNVYSAITAPAGWTLLNGNDPGSNNIHLKIFTKLAASEGSSYSFATAPDGDSCLDIVTVRGANPDTSTWVSGTTSTPTTSLSRVAPSLSGSGALLLCHAMIDRATSGTTLTYTPPSGMSEVTDHGTSWVSQTVVSLANPSNPTGAKTFTVTATPDIGIQSSILIPVAPVPKTGTLTWDFSADNPAWAGLIGSFEVSGGQGVIAGIDGVANIGDVVTTSAVYDVTDSYAWVQIVQAGDDPNLSTQLALVDANNLGASWAVGASGSAVAHAPDGTVVATRTHTDGDYYRISESGGTLTYEYGTNGFSWTSAGTAPVGALVATAVTANVVGIAFAAMVTPQTVIFDNLNLSESVAWFADAALAVTVSRTGATARATSVAASLAVAASTAVSTSRGQSMDASLAVAATQTDVGRYDAAGQSNLFLSAVFAASGMKTLNSLASLAITATPSASATGGKTVDATLALTATQSAVAASNRVASGVLPVTATPSAAASRGQSIDATVLALTAAPSAAALAQMIGQANLVANVNMTAIAMRTANVAASLGLTVGRTASVIDGIVDGANLAVAVTRMASAVQIHLAAASLALSVQTGASAGSASLIGADLAILVLAAVNFEGLREIVYVPFDDRRCVVPAVDRTATVLASDRHADVAAVERLVSVLADDRASSVDAVDRHAIVVSAPRFAVVPAEITRVLA